MTTNRTLTVLVTGATGKQGGAAARALLARGHRVRALTRNTTSPAAEALRHAGAELATGNFDDRTSLEQAIGGTNAIFTMCTPFEAGTEAETRQGIAIVDAARAVGTQHFVFSSVAGADRKTGIPHFESKLEVEEHLRRSALPFTIIAPVYFMENLLAPWNVAGLENGVFAQALPAGRKLQQIAVDDIGAFAALVIDRRDQFLGTRMDLASDELTSEEMVTIVSNVSGKQIRYQELPLEAIRADNADLAAMLEWFDRVGYSADIAAVRQTAPDIRWHRFEDWAREQDWSFLGSRRE
ncbi:MAG: NAD(P)H-binding protein [Luteitalea sp.]|nr:NAD(P)H-binding protein [Luteitalea sp.]